MDYSSERAADALAFINESRVKLVAASETPPLRHGTFAGLMGGLVAAPVLPVVLRGLAFVLLMLGVVLIVQWDRRRMGMFINGYRAGATRWVTCAMLAVILPLYVVSDWLAVARGAVWVPVTLGIVAAAIAYAGSLWWCRVFRREMLGGVA